jgi:general secretion pathway protein I
MSRATPGRDRARPAACAWNARGFTLIEVLAALVIVGLGMLSVIQAVTQAARNGTYLREKTLAHWIAMNLITERRLLTAPPEIGKSSDVLEFANTRWRWNVDVSETAVESMRRMDVRVALADAPDDSSLATAIGFYGTAIAPSGTSVLTWEGTPGRGGRPGEDEADGGDDDAGADPAENTPSEPDPPAEGDE